MLLAGIDEAGYGPVLGPLCVGMAVLRSPDTTPPSTPADPHAEAPDLWKALISGVSRKPDRTGRIPVADSKALKLANDTKTRHPLIHLERGVLSFLHQASGPCTHDADLFEKLGLCLPDHACYQVDPTPLPIAGSSIAIAANLVQRACAEANLSVLAIRAHAISEDEFNTIVDQRGTKAEATLEAIGRHLATLLELQRQTPEVIHLVCDRLGGRQSYGSTLSKLMQAAGAPAWVDVLHESPDISAYTVRHDHGTIRVDFRVEGESAWLPTALASMTAKFTRELAMHRFNRYWSTKLAELKPTAGYYADAQRWLKDAQSVLTDADRHTLIRRS